MMTKLFQQAFSGDPIPTRPPSQAAGPSTPSAFNVDEMEGSDDEEEGDDEEEESGEEEEVGGEDESDEEEGSDGDGDEA